MRRLLPRSLAGQLIALLVLALVVAQAISLAVFAEQRRHAVETVVREQVLARTAAVVRLLNDSPAAQQSRVVETASSSLLRFWIAEAGAVTDATAADRDNPLARQLTALLEGALGGPAVVRIHGARDGFRTWWRPGERRFSEDDDGDDYGDDRDEDEHDEDEHDGDDHWRGHGEHAGRWDRRHGPLGLTIAAPLQDGRWLNAATLVPRFSPAWAGSSLLFMTVMVFAIFLIVILVARRMTRPLRALAEAADGFGRGAEGAPLEPSGPDDIRRTTRAFNAMRERIQRFVQDRTRLLAAISHDMRTPITTLRLRAEFIEDGETRGKILDTLEEMQRMTEATLAFAREEATPEKTRPVDLAALVQSLADDLAEIGRDVSFAGAERLTYACRTVGLKRALRNLIENAAIYGKAARVSLDDTREGPRIVIDDDGPGIPEADLERVFEPFVRLEESRSQETGGIGLGMAIARSIVRGHGGDILLENRPEGGLRVTVTLPREAGPKP